MNATSRHIILLGFMASGKSTIGKTLSRRLGVDFVDLDAYIEDSEGLTVSDIFARYGEAHFRQLESHYLKELTARSTQHVIALGGGTPCNEANIRQILRSGVSFYLHVDHEVLVSRLQGSTTRPLVAGKSREAVAQIVHTKMTARRQWYEKANHTVRAHNSKQEAVEDILQVLNNQHMNTVDILAIGVHPDDLELCAAGTILKHIDQGKRVAICDLTAGELGTRGSGPLRIEEAKNSGEILGVVARENLGMADGFFRNDKDNVVKLVEVIRKYRPQVVLANALSDRHPDHGRAAQLISEACFYSGLRKIETETREVWRPKAVYHYIQDRFTIPDLVVEVTPYMDKKFEAIMAFKSQFFDPDSPEPATPISGQDFMEYIKAQGRIYGRYIGATYGEGFKVERPVGVDDLTTLL